MTVCLTMLNKCNKCVLNNNQSKYNFLSSSQRMFSVVLLDDSSLDICVDAKGTIGDLFQKVCDKLQLKEYDIFGISQKIKNEHHFVSNEEKISKFLSSQKQHHNNNSNSNNQHLNQNHNSNNLFNMNTNILYNQSSNGSVQNNSIMNKFVNNLSNQIDHNHNLQQQQQQQKRCDAVSYSSISISNKAYTQTSLSEMSACSCLTVEPTITVYFSVKYYVTDPLLLRDAQTRHLYYLQLRRNYLSINHKMSDEKYFVLASLALLVDYGPFNPDIHVSKYFNINCYFPKWIIAKLGEKFIYANMPRLHEQQSRHTIVNAQNKFCLELSDDEYAFNFHLYNVYKNKEETPGTICLGIAPKGILVFELRSQIEISLISTFCWSSVAKLNADKKKFEILINYDSKVRKYAYYTSCEKFSKYLLELSKSTHTFTSNIFARLANQKTLANYVNESYSEKVLAYNESQPEPYEEREIKVAEVAKTSSDERCCPKKVDYMESERSRCVDTEMNEQLSSSDDKTSSSLSSLSMSSYESPVCLDYSKMVNGINLDSLDLTFDENVNDVSSSSKMRTLKQRLANSFMRTESLNDYYEYNKKILNESDATEYQDLNDDDDEIDENSSIGLIQKCLLLNNTRGSVESSCSYEKPTTTTTKTSLVVYPKRAHSPPIIQFNSVPNMKRFDSNRSRQRQQNNSHTEIIINKKRPSNDFNSNMKTTTNAKSGGHFPTTPPPLPSQSLTNRITPNIYFTQITRNSTNEYLNEMSSDEIYQNEAKNNNSSSSIPSELRNNGELKSELNIDPDYVNNYYIKNFKSKNPPSYEESLRKMVKKHSASSSLSSSSFNDETDSSGGCKPSPTNQQQQQHKKNKIYENYDDRLLKNNPDENENTDNGINLSIENLEEIRATAASMSLPLLTALCSDQSLIRSLAKNSKNQASF